MGVVVAFSFDAWIATFPEFTNTVNSTQANMYLAMAVVVHKNDGSGPVSDAAQQTVLLNLMVAHISQLFVGTNTDPASTGVGRVANAGEGSVSASFDYSSTQPAEWYNQTKYGAMYWQMTAPFRQMRYIPGRRRILNPFYPFIG